VRVIHVVPALFSSNGGVVGGAERYALELARYIANEVPTTLVTFGDKERTESVGGLKIHVIGQPHYVRGQRGNPLAARKLLGFLRNGDIVHCHQQHVVSSSLAALFCRITGRRVFVSDLGGGGWDVSAYVSTDAWYHGHLHISEYSRKIFGHCGSPRAHVILGGVDVEKFSPDDKVAKNGSILFVGRLLPHKGINDLINAVTPEMNLEIVGHPQDRKFYNELEQLAAGKNVSFRQDFDDEALTASYRQALCVVLPSVYNSIYGTPTIVPELLGQTLLEGMACGTPAICTDVASMPEIVEDGVSGFIVPPNNPEALREKLVWLAANPQRAREMGTAARRRVLDRFTWPLVVQRCLQAYSN
jgi:glycosyltransferase involved in cell wall biosynthesis